MVEVEQRELPEGKSGLYSWIPKLSTSVFSLSIDLVEPEMLSVIPELKNVCG